MKIVIAQILGIAVTLICLICPQLKYKWQMLSCTILANCLSALNFLLLEQVSATGVSAVAILQAVITIWHTRKNKRASGLEIAVFSILYIVGGLLPFAVAGTLSSFRVLDAVPIFGALLLMCSMVQKKEQHMRLFGLSNAVVYTVYDIIIKSTQVFAQLFSIVSISIALYRYHKAEKMSQSATDEQ